MNMPTSPRRAGSRLKGGCRQDCLPHKNEEGFALLLVFLMASMIAISLYMEVPRVAFQAERQKEQLLMERGMQYKRAIGLFVRMTKNTRWPASIDELENFNNRRCLRKRYIDPITGKDEWRLIHIQNGVLMDSVTNKRSDSQQKGGLEATGFIGEIPTFAQTGSDAQGSNPALRRRPSDAGPTAGPDGQPIQGAPGGTDSAGTYPGAPPPPGSVAPGTAGATGAAGGIGGIGGIPSNRQAAFPGQANNQNSGGLIGGLVGGLIGGLTGGGSTPQPTVPGAPPQGFPGGSSVSAIGGPGGVPGANGQAGGVQINPSAQAAAAGLLQNLLTQPRPGGLPGLGTGQAAGTIMGSGIAGVASKAKGASIMVYANRTDFSEWEFIYDPMKFQVHNPNNSNSSAGGPGVPASTLANNSGFSAPGAPIGGGPGGAQTMSAGPGGAMPGGGFGSSPAAAGMGMGGAGGALSSTMASPMGSATGAPASTLTPGSAGTPNSGMPVPNGGSAAFGQPGLDPDIRPGKK